jgi:hypothetical protein
MSQVARRKGQAGKGDIEVDTPLPVGSPGKTAIVNATHVCSKDGNEVNEFKEEVLIYSSPTLAKRLRRFGEGFVDSAYNPFSSSQGFAERRLDCV